MRQGSLASELRGRLLSALRLINEAGADADSTCSVCGKGKAEHDNGLDHEFKEGSAADMTCAVCGKAKDQHDDTEHSFTDRGGANESEGTCDVCGMTQKQHDSGVYRDRGAGKDPEPFDHQYRASESARTNAAGLTLLRESAEGTVQVVEAKAVRSDGSFSMKVIAPGWGSSGYYSSEMLKRDGAKAFPQGTHMYLDHPTEADDRARPERSVRDLAGVTISPATWKENGWGGAGLYADAVAIGEMDAKTLDSIAPAIGVSIRAMGKVTEGEAEGKRGTLIEELVQGQSIDYVTRAGAGGTIRSVMESARGTLTTITGSTAGKPGTTSTAKEATGMDEATTKQLDEIRKENLELKQSNARLAEANAIRDARDFAVTEVRSARLPDVTKVRIVEAVSGNPPMKDGVLDRDAFKTQMSEAVKRETEYLAGLTGAGQVRLLGESRIEPTEVKREDANKSIGESLAAFGLGAEIVKGAAAGRN